MEPEKLLFALGIIFAALNSAMALPTSREARFNKQCKSICAEAKGKSKFDADSLTCFCEIAKSTTDVAINLMAKKAQENGVNLKIIQRNPNEKRETIMKMEEIPIWFDDEVNQVPLMKRSALSESGFENILEEGSLKAAPERQRQRSKGSVPAEPTEVENEKTFPLSKDSKELETALGQAAPKTIPERQRQKPEGSTPLQPTDLSKKRPPLISNNKTSPLSKDSKESGTVSGQASPNTGPPRQRQKTKGPAPTEPEAAPTDPQESGTFSGQASPNTGPPRQRQKTKGPASTDPEAAPTHPQESETVLGQASSNSGISRQRQKSKGPTPTEPEAAPTDPQESGTVLGQASPNTGPPRQRQKSKGPAPTEPEAAPTDPQELGTVLGQASPNSGPPRQRQKPKGSAPTEPAEVNSKKFPNVSNKNTFPLPESVDEVQPEAPNSKREIDGDHMYVDETYQVSRKTADKRQAFPFSDFENDLGQASPDIISERQRQKTKGSMPSGPLKTLPMSVPERPEESETPLGQANGIEPISTMKQIEASETVLEQDAANSVPERQRQKIKGLVPVESIEASSKRPGDSEMKQIETSESVLGPDAPNSVPERQRQKAKGSVPAESIEASSKRLTESETVVRQAFPRNAPALASENELISSLKQIETPETVLGQDAANSVPERQRQKTKGLAPVESTENSSKRPGDSEMKQIETSQTVLGPDAPNSVPERQRQKAKGSAPVESIETSRKRPEETFLRQAFSNNGPPLANEVESISSMKQTTRRSTASPRKSPALKRLPQNNVSIKRALESARQQIDTLIHRANQPSFNPSTIGAEIEAICASLRSVSHRMNESARNLERSALIEQIRERERERHARIQSRFGGHEERQRKLKPHLVGASNPPKDKGTAGKTEESQGKKEEQKENTQKAASSIITQPLELVDE